MHLTTVALRENQRIWYEDRLSFMWHQDSEQTSYWEWLMAPAVMSKCDKHMLPVFMCLGCQMVPTLPTPEPPQTFCLLYLWLTHFSPSISHPLPTNISSEIKCWFPHEMKFHHETKSNGLHKTRHHQSSLPQEISPSSRVYSLYFFQINYQHPSTQNHNVSCIPTWFSRLISPLDIKEL